MRRWVPVWLLLLSLPALLGGGIDARYYAARRLVAATASAGGYDTDAQAYITAVNAARSSESAAALTTTAEEILDDMVRLLKGGSAVNGQLTGLTAVNVWSSLQHFVIFRGSGNVGTGTTVKAIVGSDGTLYNGHPWDARADGSDDYISFPYSDSVYAITDHSYLLGCLLPTSTSSNKRIWILEPTGNVEDWRWGLSFSQTSSTTAAVYSNEAGLVISPFTINKSASPQQLSLVLNSGSATALQEGESSASDTYSDTATISIQGIRYSAGLVFTATYGACDIRPNYGLIVSSVLDATDRSNVHAILQAAYDALAAL